MEQHALHGNQWATIAKVLQARLTGCALLEYPVGAPSGVSGMMHCSVMVGKHPQLPPQKRCEGHASGLMTGPTQALRL